MTANPYAPPRAFVRDIVKPSATAVQADRSTRLGASLLDGLIFSVMVYPPMFIAVAIGGLAQGGQPGSEGTILLVGVLLMLIGLAAWIWLNLRQMSRTSQSLAKKYLNIKVVRSDGSPIPLGRLIWLRNVVNMLVGIIPLYALVDVLFIFGESRQCLHDRIADTMVVKA